MKRGPDLSIYAQRRVSLSMVAGYRLGRDLHNTYTNPQWGIRGAASPLELRIGYAF